MARENLSLVANNTKGVKAQIDTMVENANKALEKFMEMTQEQVDNIVKAMALAGIQHHMRLAKLAAEEYTVESKQKKGMP